MPKQKTSAAQASVPKVPCCAVTVRGAADIERLLAGAVPPLMVTDPPYGVDYDPSWRLKAGRVKRPGQARQGPQRRPSPIGPRPWRLFPGSAAYVVACRTEGLDRPVLARAGPVHAPGADHLGEGSGWRSHAVIYHWQHEPCWYGVREGHNGCRTGDRRAVSVSVIVARGNVPEPEIFEPFCGSGSSIIARRDAGAALLRQRAQSDVCPARHRPLGGVHGEDGRQGRRGDPCLRLEPWTRWR